MVSHIHLCEKEINLQLGLTGKKTDYHLECMTCSFNDKTPVKSSLLTGPRLLACEPFVCSVLRHEFP